MEKEKRDKMSSSAPTGLNPSDKDAVVITGISGRFPESKNIQEFWDKLMAGKVMNSADDRRWPVGEFIYSLYRLIKIFIKFITTFVNPFTI